MSLLNKDEIQGELKRRGAPLEVYQPSRLEVLAGFWFAILLLLFGAGLLVTAAWSWQADFESHEGAAVLLLIAGIAVLGCGIYLRVAAHRESQRRVYWYDDGLVLVNHAGGIAARYEDMEAVWADVTRHTQDGIPISTTHVYTVDCRDGSRFIVNDLCLQAEKVGERIQKEVARHMLPRSHAQYEAGQTVVFGRLSVSRQGISDGAKHLYWQDVKGVRVEQGEISILKEGKWFSWSTVTVAETPNLLVFLALVSTIVETRV